MNTLIGLHLILSMIYLLMIVVLDFYIPPSSIKNEVFDEITPKSLPVQIIAWPVVIIVSLALSLLWPVYIFRFILGSEKSFLNDILDRYENHKNSEQNRKELLEKLERTTDLMVSLSQDYKHGNISEKVHDHQAFRLLRISRKLMGAIYDGTDI